MEVVLPVVLLLVLGGFGALVARSVKRRKDFLTSPLLGEAELPDLVTDQRVTGTLRRLWRDPKQGLPLAELGLAGRNLPFCATDLATEGERYKTAVGKPTTLALYGLATLAPGGIEAMKEQIRDADKVPADSVLLVREGELENDYVVICRLLSQREALWGELPLVVYRAQVLRSPELSLELELAVVRQDGDTTLPNNSLAHGSVRLFGYLP